MAAIPFLKRNVKSFARSRGLNLVRGFIVACVASCAGGDSTTPTPVIPPSIATTITASEGSQAIRTAGLVLSPSPTVTVLDQNGKIMSGVPITATVSGGGGSLSGSPTATLSAEATPLGTWTLGPIVGANTLTVAAGSLSPVVITINSVAGAPANLSINQGNAQSASAGTLLPIPPSVIIRDVNSNPVGGVAVTFTATGGGTITGASATTAATGIATVGSWTLGNIAGINSLSAVAPSAVSTAVVFTATGLAGPPVQIVLASGNSQTALAGATVAGIGIKVADQFGNGVQNRTVTVDVAEGGGSVVPGSGTTDATGSLGGINWTLGKSAVRQTLSIASGTLKASPSATVQTSYNLEVRYFGEEPSASIKVAFDNAVARIKGAIVGTLGTVAFTNVALGDPAQPNTNCGITGVTLNEVVRDAIIYARIKPIDGPGKVLGSAGPCLVRNTSRLTIVGVMEFDSDDLAALAVPVGTGPTRLEQVILHEMSHVVGFGTLWDARTPSLIVGAGGADPRFSGTRAAAECTLKGGTTLCVNGIAVENCIGIPDCSAGTRDSHWREGSGTTIAGFKNELMTGFIASGVANPFSNITIQSFADLGYTVNGLAADSFSVSTPSLNALLQLGEGTSDREWERLRLPKAMVSRTGLVQQVVQQQ